MQKSQVSFKILLFIAFVSMCISCSEQERESIVDDELIGYINSFVEEGAKRGVDVSIEGLEAYLLTEFSEDKEDTVCGWATLDNSEYQRIEILLSQNCWGERSDLEKENLMYHELGHALLNRRHLNGTLPNQATQKSIMCSRVCNNFNMFYEEGPMREYYLDELFDQNASFPASIENKDFKRVVYEIGFEEDDGDYLVLDFDGPLSDSSYTVKRDSIELNRTFEFGLNVSTKESVSDSMILFKSFDFIDFEPHSNLKAKAKIISNDFKGRIDFGMSIRDRNDSSFSGFSRCQREYLNTEINGDIEVEFYGISSRTELVSVFFLIYTNGPSNIFIDDIQVELLE